jgi:hypothetical protein
VCIKHDSKGEDTVDTGGGDTDGDEDEDTCDGKRVEIWPMVKNTCLFVNLHLLFI